MKNVIVSLLVILVLSGCAARYAFEGQQYDSNETFLKAVEDKAADTLAFITPFKAPISNKKLIMAMPSEQVFNKLSDELFIKINKKEPNSLQKEMMSNLNRSNYLMIKIFFDAIQKKNIYRETQFIIMQSGVESFAPSSNVDVFYLNMTDAKSEQLYFASEKNGREIFGYDRSAPTVAGKVQAALEAIQTRAIRE